MVRGTQRQAQDEAERHDAETRLYEPVRQTPPEEPTYVAPEPYPVNVNVMGDSRGDGATRRAQAARRCNAVIGWIAAVIAVLVAIRFVLKAVAANASAPFTAGIYGITDPLVNPFVGVVGAPTYGAAVFEFPDLLAIAIYLLAGYLLTRLIRIIFIDQSH